MAFTEIGRERQYEGHVFDVVKVHLRLPDNRERTYDLVEHGDSITILPIDAENRVYFVRQHRIGAGGELLELPAGVLDDGEVPHRAAQREIREEIGLAAGELLELGGFYLAPGYTDEYMTIFLARDLYEAPLDPDEDEFLKVETMSLEEVYQKALSGGIKDGKTLAALLLAWRILEP